MCTLTVIAAGVTDQDTDDPTDAMRADVTSTFATKDTDPVCARPRRSRRSRAAGLGVVTGAVTTRGVVVGDYEGPSPAQRGFFLQDRDR